MELSLVAVKDETTGRVTYFGVNDKHYDAMLCGELEGFSWRWLGQIIIEEEILNEEGYYYGKI